MSEKEKSAGTLLKEKLFLQKKNGGLLLSEQEVRAAFDYCEGYKEFISRCKTEREFTDWCVPFLEEKGFRPFDPKRKYAPGDKLYINNRHKALLAAVIGKRPPEEGLRIAAAHIDSPRLDVKPNPVYEDTEIALFKTHYYGGIKRYQWGVTPLALKGVIVRADGTSLTVSVGEEEGEPCFCVTDLLPHLAKEQMERKLADGLKGEELNVVVGSLPFRDDEASELVKLNILNLLFEKYGVTEADFRSAELTFVPAGKARDIGFDRGLIGAYGHDDRVCAYGELTGLLAAGTPEYTAVACFADKEETGSDGPTGMNGKMLAYFAEDLGAPCGVAGRAILSASKCISADVSCAVDPTFPDVTEKNNAAYLSYGVVMTKYTGSGGKYSTNDAPAEFLGEVRRVFDEAQVLWQTGELGKTDGGGGGTVAKYISRLGVDTVDVGVPLLSMHAPLEIASKIDILMMHRAAEAFYRAK